MLSPYVTGYAVISLPKLAAELRAQGMTVTCLPLLGSKWLKGLRLLLACFVVPYMLLRFRIRTVQLNGFFESLLLGPLRLAGCRTIFTMHIPFETDLYSWFWNPARFFPRLLSKHSLRFASRVVCVSETIGEIARGVLPQNKVKVIANWVEAPARLELHILSSKASAASLRWPAGGIQGSAAYSRSHAANPGCISAGSWRGLISAAVGGFGRPAGCSLRRLSARPIAFLQGFDHIYQSVVRP